MTEPLRVPVEVLRRASQILLDHLEGIEGEVVLLDPDFFWAISPEQVYDVFNEPSEFTVGQLTECLKHLEEIVEDPSRSLSYGLVWLADVIRAAGAASVR
ncbi:hypothetical protein [Kineosporia sp. NBRC 101731]|uniref:hypothetical protein n=1 Tax=Kineosporia sp. NBRC 101731 TaxID=3032199 RepID=UPI0024A2BACB|nr:hypothetical protein [Kineosporia sp. NBRC 101731]GLY33851.1 hypothetical protein Kisp02_72160 [Kineosporia sp. NBRC 101731]